MEVHCVLTTIKFFQMPPLDSVPTNTESFPEGGVDLDYIASKT